MIESYFVVMATWAGLMLFLLIISCAAHMDFRDAESAGKVRMMLYAFLIAPIWPLVLLAGLLAAVYAVVKSVGEVFKKEYR